MATIEQLEWNQLATDVAHAADLCDANDALLNAAERVIDRLERRLDALEADCCAAV